MRISPVLLVVSVALCAGPAEWKIAEAPYRFVFPRDHFNHPDYRTEWWYYTGNLKAQNGRKFGFELTFFRSALSQAGNEKGVWDPDQIYLAHFAISDLDKGKYYYRERLNRAGPGIAGVSFDEARCWNGNWQVHWLDLASAKQELQAVTDQAALTLTITAEK